MPSTKFLFRRQTSALLIRTLHWQRRQYCTLVCNLIIPPLALVLLAVLSRVIKPAPFNAFPFEQQPKGAFVARPFNPTDCIGLSLSLSDALSDTLAEEIDPDSIFSRCRNDSLLPINRIPVYIPDNLRSSIGAHNTLNESKNTALLSHFSLDPFVYPPAVDDQFPFYSTQTPYDGVFRHSIFHSKSNNSFYKQAAALALERGFDKSYDSQTLAFNTRSDFLSTIYDAWFSGGLFETYSAALSFNSYTISDDSLSLSSTIFYNESASFNCTQNCALTSGLIRLYAAVYKQVAPEKSAFAYLRRMPKVDPFDSLGILPLIISVVIGLLSHFLFPVFLRFLVLERTCRLRSMMASMGLRRFQYWFGTYLSLLIFYLLCSLLLIIVGIAANIPFFTDNTPIAYVVLLFLWGNVLIAMAMLFEPFFSNPETAQTVGWLFIFLVNLIGGPFVGERLSDENTGEGMWSAIMLLPSFAYMRSVYYAGALNSGGKGVTFRQTTYRDVELGMCTGEGPFCRSFLFLGLEWLVFIILAAYFDRVLPTAVGMRQHPLFFLGMKRNIVLTEQDENEKKEALSRGSDVIEEEKRAHEIVNSGNMDFDGVVLDRLSKTYHGKPPVKALKGLSLVARRNDVVCILAHNGAGKTTAFRTLVGELEATSGTAVICGNSVITEMDKVHRSMGVAPQQDILWDVLSVREHLFFYGRVKNLVGQELKEAVEQALDSVQLKFAAKRQVRALSGGMKRRLSVSIAMIGKPDFIILDEPSTGLDMLARQKLWEAIGRVKEDKIIMLTTHSLEEAEVLSTRVAIMSRGELKCIGTAEELKMRLGKGHHLMVSLPASKVSQLHAAVMQAAVGTSIETVLGGNVEYVLPRAFPIPRVFALIAEKREQLEIRDWSINQSSLEDVFMRVTKGSFAEADEAKVEEP